MATQALPDYQRKSIANLTSNSSAKEHVEFFGIPRGVMSEQRMSSYYCHGFIHNPVESSKHLLRFESEIADSSSLATLLSLFNASAESEIELGFRGLMRLGKIELHKVYTGGDHATVIDLKS